MLPCCHNITIVAFRTSTCRLVYGRSSHTPFLLQESPEGSSSPHNSDGARKPPKRGSTTSPGQEALSKAAHLLALLVCCHVSAELAPDGLALINDLVQLLYYHGSNVAHKPEEEAANENIHLLSPLVQVCGRHLITMAVQSICPVLLPEMYIQ